MTSGRLAALGAAIVITILRTAAPARAEFPVPAEPWTLGFPPPSALDQHLEYDGSDHALSVEQRWRDVVVGHPARLGLDSRVDALARQSLEASWRAQIRELRTRGDLSSGETALNDVTRIDIPITFPSAVSSIIGQGANVEVTGSEEITFGGESNYIVEDKNYGFGQRSRFPQLDMRQHLRVNMNGNIGEKVQVQVDHDSETQTPLENRIKLRYNGTEDEVIQSIEMGNTNLSIGGAQFVGYNGTAEGLFGAKMVGRLGNFDFTTIASKQEGRTSHDTFVGQAREEDATIRDIDYERRRFFSVRIPSDPDFLVTRPNDVDSVTVWVDDNRGDNDRATGAQPGIAYLNWADRDSSAALHYGGMWVPLQAVTDYVVNQDAGIITFQQPVESEYSVAVSYYSRADSQWVGFAGAAPNDTLGLQMIHPGSYLTNNWELGDPPDYATRTPWAPLFESELKYVYSLGARNISQSDYEITIRRPTEPDPTRQDNQNGTPYIRLMGLDRATFSSSGQTGTTPDGIVDPTYIDFDAGLLYFRNTHPFDPSSGLRLGVDPAFSYSLNDSVPQIYNKSEDFLRLHPELSHYQIYVQYRTPQTTFRLNRVGIIRDSETVTLNGRALQRGVDYQIDYDLGQVTFLTEEASAPDARIAIDFEYAPLLAQSQKTLLGMSGTYTFTEQNRIGITGLFENSTTPELRPRLGQEPSRTILGDMNFQLQHDSDASTRWIDHIPLVRAQSPSQFHLAGEVARSIPNPNTKNEVYLDDMDGTEDVRSLFATWRLWEPASRPAELDPAIAAADAYRTNWYSPRDLVKERDLHIGLSGIEGDALRTVLEIRAHPDQDTLAAPPDSAWFGIERLLSTDGSNLSEQKFLEVWVENGPRESRHGTMHVDLGDVSENFYRPDSLFGGQPVLDDEDTNHDGILDESEDVGLDDTAGTDADHVPGDDGNDDYQYDFDAARYEYRHINGTERNRIRDSEDLNRNGRLDTIERYFSVAVPLADGPSEFLAIDNADSTRTSERSDWRLFRIPLDRIVKPETGRVQAASWTSIKDVRVWFSGFEPGEPVHLASLDVVGNSWLEDGVRQVTTGTRVDTLAAGERVDVQVRNNKENSEYTPPFDPGEDQTPQGRLPRREQSLALVYSDLATGRMGSAHKTVIQTTDASMNDYSEYRSLSFYVRANNVSPSGGAPTFFVRMGTDSSNFYEYRKPIEDTHAWNQVDVPLGDLPLMKLQAATDTIQYNNAASVPIWDPAWGQPPGTPVSEGFAIYGRPTLTRVLYLAVGVRNDQGTPISGELWVDELRLRDIRKSQGHATALNATAHLSDLLDANANFTTRDTEFRTLGGDRTGADDHRLSWGGRFNLHKFFESSGLAVPVSYNVTTSSSHPRLRTGSDILVTDAIQSLESTTSNDRSYSVSVSHPKVSRTPWGRLFLDGISTSASYTLSHGESPVQSRRARDLRSGVQYLLAPPWDARFTAPGGVRLAYLPQSITLRADGSRTTERVYAMLPGRVRGARQVARVTRAVAGTLALRATPLEAGTMSTDYSFEMHRDLDPNKNVRLLQSLSWGTETTRQQSVGWRFQPGIFGLVTPLLSYNGSYNEDRRAQARREGDPPGLRQVANSGEFRATASVSPAGSLRRLSSWWQARSEKKAREAERPKPGATPEAAPEQPAPGVAPPPPGTPEAAPPDTSHAPGEAPGPAGGVPIMAPDLSNFEFTAPPSAPVPPAVPPPGAPPPSGTAAPGGPPATPDTTIQPVPPPEPQSPSWPDSTRAPRPTVLPEPTISERLSPNTPPSAGETPAIMPAAPPVAPGDSATTPPPSGELMPASPPALPPMVPSLEPPAPAADTTGAPVPRTDAGAPITAPTPAAPPAAPRPKTTLLKRVSDFSQKIADISVNFSRRRSSRYDRATGRPSLAYQAGLDLAAPGQSGGQGLVGGAASSRSIDNSLSLRSGLRPVPGMNLDANYTSTGSHQLAAGSDAQSRSKTWPELTLNISSLEKFGHLGRLVERASLTSTVRRKVDTTLNGGRVRNERSQLAFAPLFQLTSTLRNKVQVTVTGNYSRSSTVDHGGIGTENRSTDANFTTGVRYSYRPKKAFKLLPTKSTTEDRGEVKLSTDLRIAATRSEQRTGATDWDLSGKTLGFSIEPSASYTFGGNLTGSAEAHFAQDKDQKRGETRRRIGLFLTLSVRF